MSQGKSSEKALSVYQHRVARRSNKRHLRFVIYLLGGPVLDRFPFLSDAQNLLCVFLYCALFPTLSFVSVNLLDTRKNQS